MQAIATLVEASDDLRPVIVVGAPLRKGNRLYNCAVVIHRGAVLGVAPKSFLPTYREFYEARLVRLRRGPARRDDRRSAGSRCRSART